MDRGWIGRAGRWAVVLMAGGSLTACVSPQYSVRGPGGRLAPGPQAKAPATPGGRYKTGEPYQVGGIWYVPREQPNYDETGIASWYGSAFQMKATANGEIFDMGQLSAAHTTLPLPSMVEVTNLENGRSLVVRVNDRGPFVGGRIIDLSQAAARELGYERQGTTRVRVRYVGPAPLGGPQAGVRYAKASPPAFGPAAGPRPADEDVFRDAAPAPAFASTQLSSPAAAPAPLAPRPLPVSVSTLTPLPPARPADSHGLQIEVRPPGEAYRIQAGAFSDEARARRAAQALSAEGVARIEPYDRQGQTVYRVLIPGPTDEAEAYALRDKVAASGFSDARVVRPYQPSAF